VGEAQTSSLAGKRIVITRAAAQSEALARELSAHGAVPSVLPLVAFAEPEDFAPLDRAIADIEKFDWMILTSAQAVRALAERAEKLQRPLARVGNQMRVACVGPVTADAARKENLPLAHVATTHNGVALAEELGSQLAGAKVLLPRSDRANPDLPAALKRHGAEVTEVIAYRTLQPTEADSSSLNKIARGDADAVLFFSPSAVSNFTELLGMEKFSALQDKLAITAVGPVTAKALRTAGIERVVVAEDTTATSVIAALEKYFAGVPKATPAGARQA